MRPDPRRHQRLAARQLLVDLQRRVGAVHARRDQHLGGPSETQRLRFRDAAREDAHLGQAQRGGQRAHRADLLVRPAREQQPRRRMPPMHALERADDDVDPLVGLERPGIEDHGMRRVELDRRRGRRLRGPGRRLLREPHVIEDRVLDQQVAPGLDAGLERVIAQVRADGNHRVGRPQATVLQPLERADEQLRLGEAKVLELLRQARVHVVDQPETEDRLEEPAPEHGFLMGVDHRIPMPGEHPDGPQHHEHIEEQLLPRGADRHRLEPANPRDAHDPHAGDVHVLAGEVGQQVDRHALLGHHQRAVIDAERRAARREKRVRCDDQHLHEDSSLRKRLWTWTPIWFSRNRKGPLGLP